MLSILAGTNADLIHQFSVYMCPNTDYYRQRLTRGYVCFRHIIDNVNGVTDCIYKIKGIYQIVPADANTLRQIPVTEISRNDLNEYCTKYFPTGAGGSKLCHPHILITLSKYVALSHLPRPK